MNTALWGPDSCVGSSRRGVLELERLPRLLALAVLDVSQTPLRGARWLTVVFLRRVEKEIAVA